MELNVEKVVKVNKMISLFLFFFFFSYSSPCSRLGIERKTASFLLGFVGHLVI